MGIKGFPLIKFSGSRGVHIIYRYKDDEENALNDELKRLNLKTYFYSFPGLFELIKINSSPLKSKATFSRLIADSLITHAVFKTTILLPQEIKE